MTVEERAQKAVEKFCEDEKELRGPDGKRPISFVAYSTMLRQRIKEALQDQIEDCAKIAARKILEKSEGKKRLDCCPCMAEEIEREIRALAGSTTTEERKESER